MKLDNEYESHNVEDRRKSGTYRSTPSLGMVMMLWPLIRPLLRTKFGWILIGLGVLAYLNGFNPLSLFQGKTNSMSVDTEIDNARATFVKKVIGNTEKVWKEILPRYGVSYREPKVVLFQGGTRSACGYATHVMGPFYCPLDQKVYIDMSFFDELSKRHDAPGDFAQAYVLAHEIGHHIQNLQGTLVKVQRFKQQWGEDSPRSNALQVRVELQADCYAGVWGHHAHRRYGVLEPGDAEEALRAASAIGDDTLQRKSQGYVRPDAFTHGSSKQRMEWFLRGFQSGDLRMCDTFR